MISFYRKIRKRLIEQNLPAGQAGKVSKYLLYAISEIFLVVIGIYIAIQFNNWNEGKNNQKLVQTDIGILIENLEKDSVTILETLDFLSTDLAGLDSMIARLNRPTVNLDTLIKIARYEFEPRIHRVRFENDDAYEAMSRSGEINLLEKQIRQDIFRLYNHHGGFLEFYSPKVEQHLETVIDYSSKFGISVSTFTEGPIAEAKYTNASLADLSTGFDALMLTKTSLYRLGKIRLRSVYNETLVVLQKLRKALDD